MELIEKQQPKRDKENSSSGGVQPTVSVCVQTYQHALYIKDCLDGILMQKTDFTIEILLRDDASNDGTAEICKDYAARHPNKFNLLLYSENQFVKGVKPLPDNVKRAKGKYIAMCEGDDYWTDPLKLQKQVDFLEQNAEYVACFHKYKELVDGAFSEKILPDIEDDFVITKKNFFDKWYTKTLTVVFRKDVHSSIDYSMYEKHRDTTLFYELLKINNAICLNFIAGVYRIHQGGIWSLKSKRDRDIAAYIHLEEIYYFNQEDENLKIKIKKVLYRLNLIASYNTLLLLIKNSRSFYFKMYLLKKLLKKPVKDFRHRTGEE
ncbi:glycosyltransferase family 2 protein [Aequorivita marina]|uniref:glycosyltransferase family 2 protein n=1 Tax=Aequorivita marina TaxID=3073654 RepID=UPI0028754192|nr:glycosyltransferase [Aequorivita sp. S2608]MDS1299079.1 glycosyltransferase [Aequorivita sp. S2608]